MQRTKQALIKIVAGTVLALCGFAHFGCTGERATDADRELYKQITLFSDALTIVESEYIEEVPPKELIYGALEGMFASLDGYSQFLDPESFREIQVEAKGEFGGLGMEIGIRDGVLTIIAPMDGTPACRAGLKSGDRIIKINGELTRGITLAEAVRKLRGRPGTKVELTVWREGEGKLRNFTVVRSVIKLKSIKTAEMLDKNIGYIKLVEFQERTPAELEKSLAALEKAGMKALVLDLRNNPGGLLDVANRVAEKFLPAGKTIVSVKRRPPRAAKVFKSRGRRKFLDFPMVVLVNEGSASASEVVAGALRDNKRAVLVGAKTFGKGCVQTILPLKDGSAVRLTTAAYYTPSGMEIRHKGLVPDVEVEFAEKMTQPAAGEDIFEKAEEGKTAKPKEPVSYDTQLQAAIDVLRGMLIYKSGLEAGEK